MSESVLHVDRLSKRYVIEHQTAKGDGLRHAIEAAVRSPVSWIRGRINRSPSDEEFWALREISFSVKQGEVVGIIGRNGAGKSTLLKILSRITGPTSGRVRIRGRVASLLEVGTGFHPQLTGRENIYLNGAVLGMSHAGIKRKFEDIVTFSGVEKFLDTPVKRYSSGMYVRLAFSVAAHLEPDILIIDEVLAVGDAEFQRKCLGRMNTAAKEGRTVLFVSHSMSTVQSLCTRAIYLRDGKVIQDGAVDQVMASYSNAGQQLIDTQPLEHRVDRVGGEQVRVTAVDFVDAVTGEQINTLLSGQDVYIHVHFASRSTQTIVNVAFAVAFFSTNGVYLFSCNSETVGSLFEIDSPVGTCVCRIKKWPLTGGRYTFNVLVTRNETVLDWVKEAGYVDAENGDFYGTGKLPHGSKQGVLIDYQWEPPLVPSLAEEMSRNAG